jgi:hypothetical protein
VTPKLATVQTFTSFEMEAFLSSLPPYVHEFLAKEPPFEAFNVLRELICFAVLYSNDRKNIQRQTERLLKENAQVSTSLLTIRVNILTKG